VAKAAERRKKRCDIRVKEVSTVLRVQFNNKYIILSGNHIKDYNIAVVGAKFRHDLCCDINCAFKL